MLGFGKSLLDRTGITISVLTSVTFVLLCFSPPIQITSGLHVRAEDFLLPLVLLSILPFIALIRFWYFTALFIWCLYGFVSMFVNDRIFAWNDYFEFYKLFKYVSFVILFYLFFKEQKDVFITVSMVFAGLVLFNILHFYNIFHFNELVMPAYATNPLHLEFFGKNSLGGPDTKRIIGTMGNPNINGILFSIFSIYYMSFLSKKEWHWGKFLFYVSLAFVLLTQSRTCMLAFGFFFPFYILMHKPSFGWIIKSIAYIVATVLIVRFADKYSMNYVTNAKLNVAENGSLRGRLEVWNYLGKMILEKPIFGHGINKNYFYSHKLYSENEYLLMAWRYGIGGLIFYLSMLGGLVIYFFKKWYALKNEIHIFYVQIVILYGVNALTNNPLSDPVLLVFFALSTGMFLSQFALNEKVKVDIV